MQNGTNDLLTYRTSAENGPSEAIELHAFMK